MKINFDTTASFDVDAQKGFSPVCPDELPVPDGDKIVDELNAQATFAKYRIGSKDWHHNNAIHIANKENPQFSKVDGYPNIDIRWNAHCIGSTKGAELLDGLPDPIDYDYFVWKGIEANLHPYGACYHDLANKRSTGVIEWLKNKDVDTVIVGGLALDFCVLTTVVQLFEAGLTVIVNLEACKAISAPTWDGETTLTKAMKQMQDLGVEFIYSSKELTK